MQGQLKDFLSKNRKTAGGYVSPPPPALNRVRIGFLTKKPWICHKISFLSHSWHNLTYLVYNKSSIPDVACLLNILFFVHLLNYHFLSLRVHRISGFPGRKLGGIWLTPQSLRTVGGLKKITFFRGLQIQNICIHLISEITSCIKLCSPKCM